MIYNINKIKTQTTRRYRYVNLTHIDVLSTVSQISIQHPTARQRFIRLLL